jgi:hypothetical protein
VERDPIRTNTAEGRTAPRPEGGTWAAPAGRGYQTARAGRYASGIGGQLQCHIDHPPRHNEASRMTENPRSVIALPESVKAELHAASARRIATCAGPIGSSIEFWAKAHDGLLHAQRHSNGDGLEMFWPLDNTNSTAALIDALRLYLVSGATK